MAKPPIHALAKESGFLLVFNTLIFEATAYAMKIKTLALVLALSSWFYASAQESLITIHESLTEYLREFPQEKVYFHLDKPFYAAGDTIWFKAYLADAMLHLPLPLSKVLYVDIIKEDHGRLISHNLVRINQGFSHGQITLPDTLAEGLYQIRAYTNWMRNFPQDFFFKKDIRVYSVVANPPSLTESDVKQLDDAQYLDFFPEGGNFVAGLLNRIAFKAVNLMGQGVKVEGYVLSDRSDTVTNIVTHHSGLGHFMMIPQKGHTYSAHIKLKNGEIKKYRLPDLLDEGYVMQVDNVGASSIRVIIRHNLQKPDSAILFAHQRGAIIYGAQAVKDKKEYRLLIPKAAVPDDGIVHLTLFGGNGIPECERLVYMNKERPHHISFTPEEDSDQPQGHEVIDITIKDADGNPVHGNFSLSVTDKHQVTPDTDAGNIQSYFYLTSDITSSVESDQRKETIENPSYYFNDANKLAFYHMDLLLMTQGWRRFLWRDVLKADDTKPVFPIENGITVKGQVLRLNGKTVRDSVNLVLMSTSKNQQRIFATGISRPDGRFEFSGLDVYDSATVLVHASKGNGAKNLDVSFSEPVLPEIPEYQYPINPLLFNRSSVENFLKKKRENAEFEQSMNLNRVHMLETVVIEGKREAEPDIRRISYGTPDATVKIDNSLCGSALNVLQMLQGRVAGVVVNTNPTNPTNSTVSIRGQVATILVDGIRVTDPAFISPCDVEAIDVIRDASIGGGSGVVSILTKRGNVNYDFSKDKARGTSIMNIAGYLVPREFYTPRYENLSTAPYLNDFRSTIYWNPEIVTDALGKCRIIFPIKSTGTTVRLVLEGLTEKGKAIAGSYEYEVK